MKNIGTGIILGALAAFSITSSSSAWAGYYDKGRKEDPNNNDIQISVFSLAYAENKLRIEQRRLLRWQNRLKRFQRELDNLEERDEEISQRQGEIYVERLDAGEDNRRAQLRLSRERIDLRVEQINNRRRVAELKLLLAAAKRKIKTHTFWVEQWTLDVKAAKKRLVRADRR